MMGWAAGGAGPKVYTDAEQEHLQSSWLLVIECLHVWPVRTHRGLPASG